MLEPIPGPGCWKMAWPADRIEPGEPAIHASFTVCVNGECVGATRRVYGLRRVWRDTLNLDERGIAAAAVRRARERLWPVHYVGVPCEMDEIVGLPWAAEPRHHRGRGRLDVGGQEPACRNRLGDPAAGASTKQ